METRLEGPLDLEACLLGGQSFVWRRVDGAYEGVVGDRLVEVTPLPPGEGIDDGRSNGGPTGAVVRGLPPHKARAYFRAADDHAAARRRLGRDPAVAPLVDRWPGLRVLRTDPWTCLVSFILSQNSHVARITRNLADLSAALGDPVGAGADGRPRHATPPPERIVDAGEARLRRLGVGYRAPYLVEAARMVADGDLPLSELRGAGHDEARRALMEVPGVGPKVADCVLLFSLDQRSAFPVDRWVARALADRCPEAPARPDEARAFARARFGDDAGLAQQLLFWDRREAGR